jgi:hypothetical protein
VIRRSQFPKALKKRVGSYYDLVWKNYRSLDGNLTYFFPELSKDLACEVIMYLRIDLIDAMPIFDKCRPEIVKKLVLCVALRRPPLLSSRHAAY